MSQTYPGKPVLSQIKINNTAYYMKDADARNILDSFNNIICEGVIGTVSDNNDSFVTAKNIKAYVDSAVSIGLSVVLVAELPSASADTMGKIYLVKHSTHTEPTDTCDEYITVRSGSGTTEDPYVYTFEKIGNTDIDLSAYVTNVSYTDSRELQQTRNGQTSTIHTFGTLADKSSASGTISTVDSGKVTYTPKGTISRVTSGGTKIGGTIGDITIIDSRGTLPSKSSDSFTPNTPTIIDVAQFNPGKFPTYTPGKFTSGELPSHAKDSFTANTPTVIDATKFSGGSLDGGSVIFPSPSKSTVKVPKRAFLASVNEEVLSLTEIDDSAKADAVTDITLSGGKYTAPIFSPAKILDGFWTEGTAAKYEQGAFDRGTKDTFVQGSLSEGELPSIGDKFYTVGTSASFTEGAFNAGALPTTKSFTPVFTGYNYAFVGTEDTANADLKLSDKTISVA